MVRGDRSVGGNSGLGLPSARPEAGAGGQGLRRGTPRAAVLTDRLAIGETELILSSHERL